MFDASAGRVALLLQLPVLTVLGLAQLGGLVELQLPVRIKGEDAVDSSKGQCLIF